MTYYGFNFQWMCAWSSDNRPEPADFLSQFGFNFVRIPVDYRFWTKNFDYFHPDESVFKQIDAYLEACQSRGIHLSLNLHRAPGYCTNRNDLEQHNLWLDEIAQNAFVFLWETFTRRYEGIPGEALSFDMINEPPSPGVQGMTRENHAALIRCTVAAIHQMDADRRIVIDGLGGGYLAMPELADLNVTKYPGLRWQGRTWNRAALRESYRSWRNVERRGAKIHIGEFGCFKHTPNEIAMRWLTDLLSVFREFSWGYALWNFRGPFGIVEHGRPGVKLESISGYNVDRALLELLLEHRVSS